MVDEERSEGEASATDDQAAEPAATAHTRLSGYWGALALGLVVLLVLIIFILQNSTKERITFLWAHTRLNEGIALLLAAVIGGLVVAFASAARILELRSRSRRGGNGPFGRRKR